MTEESKFFEKNNFLVVKNILNEDVCTLLYYYMKLETRRLIFLEQQNKDIKDDFGFNKDFTNYKFLGEFNDTQCPGTFSRYGCLVFDTLNLLLTPKMELLTNLKLIPTYSYHRLYKHNDILKKHKDRKSCEISTTVCLGYDISNLENKNYNWPMFVLQNGKEIPLYLNAGDMIIYRGCEVTHWREKFEGVNHGQVFLHYNTKTENNDNLYDNRPELGLPGYFKTK